MTSLVATSRIQSRPAVQLAIGDLPSIEQDHVRISLRIISPRLQVPCVAVQQSQAEITLKPANSGSCDLRLVSRFGERHIERPLRLMPLSDALTDLIDGMLKHELPAANTADGATRLLDLLLAPAATAISRIRLQSGIIFILDRGRHRAGFTDAADIALLHPGDRIADYRRLDALPTSFEHAAWLPLEQLCWLFADAPAPALRRWLDDTAARLTLISWPNLSQQPDALAWIQVLNALMQRSMRIDETVRLAVQAGIPSTRAQAGLALLGLFRHATLTRTDAAACPAQPPSPPPMAMSASQIGLLSRLRNKLRTLLA